jgi:hypothetical protein
MVRETVVQSVASLECPVKSGTHELSGAGMPHLGADSPLRTTGLLRHWMGSNSEQEIVQATLAWAAEVFATPRARFVRRFPDGTWMVQSIAQGKLVSQPADRAEIAMAWTVGLSRHAVRVTRPRVTTFDGQGVRPIAVTKYLGIPIVCNDEFLGVIEVAGNVKPDVDLILPIAQLRLKVFGERLLHDPTLRFEPFVDADTICALNAGAFVSGEYAVSGCELAFLAVLDQPTRLGDLAYSLASSEAKVIAIARNLVGRGLISLRAPTRMLTSNAIMHMTSELDAAG